MARKHGPVRTALKYKACVKLFFSKDIYMVVRQHLP